MAYIQTILGQISPEELGFCQSHEHLLLSKGISFEKNPVLLLDDFRKSIEEVFAYKASGGNAIVEAQPVGCNRVADGLQAISRETGIHIIASTGFHKMIFYPDNHWIFSYDRKRLLEIFLHEIKTGMYTSCENSETNTFIYSKAGQVKCALDTDGLNEQYQKLFLAAGRACLETGAPMMVHIEKGSDPIALVDFLEENHVRPKKMIFCHMDRACVNPEVHRQIASKGIYLEYDTIGRPKYHSNEEELNMIKTMIHAGYEDQLLISLDTTRARLKAYTPEGVGLTYLIKTFIPMMKDAGISEECIQKMIRRNPGKAFVFEQ